MLFLNPWLLLALSGVTIPVIIHLVRRQAAKPVEWGAMRFLIDTLSERRRRMEWEDLLLMAARCLLLALAALAIARPYVPPDCPTPWILVLPLILFGVGLFGSSFVFGALRKRLLVRAASLALLALAAGVVLMEHRLNLRRFVSGGSRDVALIIDASTSMTRKSGTHTLFDDALDEARRIVKDAPRSTSFAVILGGPAPQALSNTPLSHRADTLAQLEKLQVVGGTFRAHEALATATVVLAAGNRPNKDIIVLSDGQRHGWRYDDTGAWQTLATAWKSLRAKPRLILRTLPQSPNLRNAGIATITTARDLIGTDRPCLLRTEIVNTGNQPVMPGELRIDIDGKETSHEALGMLIPGQQQSIETSYRFTTPGPHVVTAHLTGHDEISGDDRADHVVIVRKAVRVVLVDGNPSGGFFERAAGHTALALAPVTAMVRGGTAGKDFLMDPVVVPAPDVTSASLADADVVVLADVTRLPAALAAAVADRTAAGAGLLILAGPRADPGFYNAWDGPDGPLLPVRLDTAGTSEKGISPAANSFRHEALAWAADERRSDLGGAVIHRWRISNLRPDCGTLGAVFNNGDPFIATRGYGRGRCAVAMCAFDARSGNLPGRAAFVPLVHELVAWSAGGGVNWNLEPAWSPSLMLDSRSSGGLTAHYFRQNGRRERSLLDRIDPAIDFKWGDQAPDRRMPRDNFSVEWRATLLPQISGDYLIEAEVDNRIAIKIDRKTVLEQRVNLPPQKARVTFKAGKPVAFEAIYEKEGGSATARVFWTPPGGTRLIIPSSAWVPAADDKPTTYDATDPLGNPRKATVSLGRRGRELRLDGPSIPGLYQVKLPPELQESITATPATAPLPLVVRNDIAESRLSKMSDADLAQLRARTDVILPQSVADVLAILSGKGFGHEITRILTVAAVLLLLLESALARWVSRSRRAGDDLRVEFGDTSPVVMKEKGGRR